MNTENSINPLVSVVLAIYNGEKYMNQAIESILSQTFTDFELIIIDDGSKDKTPELLSKFTDPRIRIITNNPNKGLVYSLNLGIAESKGKYIARMDADDISLPERLQRQVDFMENHPEIGICGAWFLSFDDDLKENNIVRYPPSDIKLRAQMFVMTPFCHPSVMIRKSVLEKHQLEYSYNYYRAEDYGLWVELLQFTQGATIPEVLLHYRRHESNETVLADKNPTDKVSTVSKIHKRIMELYGIEITSEECFIYTYMMDRAFYFDISSNSQQKLIEQVLKKLFLQLHKLGPIEKEIKRNIIKTYTWRAISQRNILSMFKRPYATISFLKGLRIYFDKYTSKI